MDAQGAHIGARSAFDPRELSGAVRVALRRAYETGRAEHGGLDLDHAVFAAGALQTIRSHLERSLGAAGPDEVAHALRTAAATDLFLARCCEEGCEGAWERLHELYLKRLQGLAHRRGADAAEADRLAGEVLADLALPPSRSEARTRLGTFAGRGSLIGWLAVVLLRSMASSARRNLPLTNDENVAADTDARRPGASVPASDPAAAAEAGETAARLRQALRLAWERCTERERLTLVFKYRDGLRQRAVAAILGVGEPRVSRLVRQALAKLRDAVSELPVGGDDPAWPALRRALEDALANFGEEVQPPPWNQA